MIIRLNRENWVDGGLRLLQTAGVEAVRVEPLAKALNVTKGSFYWHFSDRSALLEALLQAWQQRATFAIIEDVERQGGDARQKLYNLFMAVSAADGRLERAIRHWAAHDPIAKLTLDAVDVHRLHYLLGLFRDLGLKPHDALARARFVYQAVIGQFVMDGQLTSEERIAERIGIILPLFLHVTTKS